VQALSKAQCSFLVISFTTDWRFSPARSQEIVNALITARKKVCYANIESHFGHDAFLLPIERYEHAFTAYMQRVHEEANNAH